MPYALCVAVGVALGGAGAFVLMALVMRSERRDDLVRAGSIAARYAQGITEGGDCLEHAEGCACKAVADRIRREIEDLKQFT